MAEDTCVGGQVWLAPGGSEEIKGDVTLLDEMIPLAEGERWITSGEASDEVCFPCLDGTLGCIPAVDVWRYALEGNVIFGEGLFYVVGAFVVDDV